MNYNENNKTFFAYEEIRKNKLKTGLLILVFIFIVFILSVAIGNYLDDIKIGIFIGLSVTFIVIPINILSSKFMIMFSTKGKQIDHNNPLHIKAKNLVEGLSISAGLNTIPEIYILPTRIPNAFAGGFSPNSAYVGVTQGLLEIMDDLELEGVIAHEISHIAQYDILISTVAVSLMSVIIILGEMLYRISWHGFKNTKSSTKKEDNVSYIIMILSIVAILITPIIRLIGNLVNLAISRKREYLADSNAIRLCGYSNGLVSALSKLGELSKRSIYSYHDIEELGGNNLIGLYIFNPKKYVINLFSTHPPIEDRINKLKSMY